MSCFCKHFNTEFGSKKFKAPNTKTEKSTLYSRKGICDLQQCMSNRAAARIFMIMMMRRIKQIYCTIKDAFV
jgi:hypothetical protein